jgi:hypothetical protein
MKITLLDPNGQRYAFENIKLKPNDKNPKKIFVDYNKLCITDVHTNKQPIEFQLKCSKKVIHGKYEHYSCWLMSPALIAKYYLSADDYKRCGFPGRIDGKQDLAQIITALMSTGKIFTNKELCAVEPRTRNTLLFQYRRKDEQPPTKKSRLN